MVKLISSVLILLIIINTDLFSQNSSLGNNNLSDLSNKNLFNSSEQIKAFADYLFCEKDFLRAAEEYQKLIGSTNKDTFLFKQALSYSIIGDYKTASEKFSGITATSKYYVNSLEEVCKIDFLNGKTIHADNIETESIKKLSKISQLLNNDMFSTPEEISAPFNDNEKKIILDFYKRKQESGYIYPFVAGMLSALIPGSGKIYSGNISDGLTSFIVNSLLGYLAYSNFRAGHQFRGYLFGGLTLFFYAGNVYGSATEAQLYNARIKQNFDSDLYNYTGSQNYFMQDYGFCK